MGDTIPPTYYKTTPGGYDPELLSRLSKALLNGGNGDNVSTFTDAVTITSVSTNNSDKLGRRRGDEDSITTSFEGNPPTEPGREKDRWKLVYIIMILHGVGTLMPWNMFITANDYFVKFKLSKNYTGQDTKYGDDFLSYLGLASQLPAFCFHWTNIFIHFGYSGNLNKRIIYSLFVEGIIFIFTIMMAFLDTSTSPAAFFWLTMLSVVVLNVVGGIYQNCVFGIGARLGCMGGLILGSNICGTFTSLVSLVTIACAPTERKAAMFYFSSALIVIAACLVTYLLLPRNKYYRYKLEVPTIPPSSPGEWPIVEVTATGSVSRTGTPVRKEMPPYRAILKQCGKQCLNIFLIFFVTLTIFPSIHSEIKPVDKEFPIPPKYFEAVTCFLTFNLFALFGTILAEVVQWPKPERLWIPVIARFLFLPIFLLCNYQPHGTGNQLRFVFNDWIYWVAGVLLGFTSGYFSSLAMIYCPKSVSSEHSSIAGMFAIAFLVTGIVFGLGCSWLISGVW